MTNFKMTVRADCAVLHVGPPSPAYTPWKLPLKSSCPQWATGSWFFGTRVHLLPSIASFLNKTVFPFTQHLFLSIGFLRDEQLNLSSVTP